MSKSPEKIRTVYRNATPRMTEYTIIHNATAQDRQLTFEARGLLLFCISHPHDFKFGIEYLTRASPSGRDRVYKMINQLIDAGYWRRIENRKNGRVTGYTNLITGLKNMFEGDETEAKMAPSAFSGRGGVVNPDTKNIEPEKGTENIDLMECTEEKLQRPEEPLTEKTTLQSNNTNKIKRENIGARENLEEKKSGENVEKLPHGVELSEGIIRHNDFSVSLASANMTGSLRGLSEDIVKANCLQFALQWAAEIEGGKSPRDVLPDNIAAYVNYNLRQEKNQGDVTQARVDRQKAPYKTSQWQTTPSSYHGTKNKPARPQGVSETDYEAFNHRRKALLAEGYDFASATYKAKSEVNRPKAKPQPPIKRQFSPPRVKPVSQYRPRQNLKAEWDSFNG